MSIQILFGGFGGLYVVVCSRFLGRKIESSVRLEEKLERERKRDIKSEMEWERKRERCLRKEKKDKKLLLKQI